MTIWKKCLCEKKICAIASSLRRFIAMSRKCKQFMMAEIENNWKTVWESEVIPTRACIVYLSSREKFINGGHGQTAINFMC